MPAATFYGKDHFRTKFQEASEYRFLPFRFIDLDDCVVLVNEVGEHALLDRPTFTRFTSKQLRRDELLYGTLKSSHFLYDSSGSETAVRLLATKYRTKKSFLAGFTQLHIFVVSLRCEHSCHYCQVSRVSTDKEKYDMSSASASRALELVFRSPANGLKIEFQGGEPLLNFDLIRYVIQEAESRGHALGKRVDFVVTTNLALLTDEILEYFKDHQVMVSTSLDGPEHIHNANRPRPGNNSHALALEGIRRCREVLGADHVSALMTTTQLSLSCPEDIVDEYVADGFGHIVLRPISPYGFALRSRLKTGYELQAYLQFYKQALAHIIELNRQGTFFVEGFAQLLLRKILTPFPTGYVDLQSPAGAGISVAVYNYDGDVYATDEARMLAETGDHSFRLGNVHTDSYEQMFGGELIRSLAAASCVESLPGCSDCAFQMYCGCDPVENYATQRDVCGHRPTSDFCGRNMEIIRHLLRLYHGPDRFVQDLFWSWVQNRDVDVLLSTPRSEK